MSHKIFMIVIIMLAFLVLYQPTTAFADTQVKVTLPTFSIKLNDTVIQNCDSQYPLIVYKDITYFPMTYHGARFLNLKVNWYESTKVLFVGKAEKKESVLHLEKAAGHNKSLYTATIPTYQIAVNTTKKSDFLNNNQETYPILNFRNITYFPLTWRFAVEEFGWEYSFDDINGLVINSGDMFRPVLDDREVGYISPLATATDYYYGDDYYVGYPRNTFNDNYKFVVCKRGETEKTYSLREQLIADDYYFDEQYDSDGIPVISTSKQKPTINDNCFSIYCRKLSSEENVLIRIDLTTGTIISQEVISRNEFI